MPVNIAILSFMEVMNDHPIFKSKTYMCDVKPDARHFPKLIKGIIVIWCVKCGDDLSEEDRKLHLGSRELHFGCCSICLR